MLQANDRAKRVQTNSLSIPGQIIRTNFTVGMYSPISRPVPASPSAGVNGWSCCLENSTTTNQPLASLCCLLGLWRHQANSFHLHSATNTLSGCLWAMFAAGIQSGRHISVEWGCTSQNYAQSNWILLSSAQFKEWIDPVAFPASSPSFL